VTTPTHSSLFLHARGSPPVSPLWAFTSGSRRGFLERTHITRMGAGQRARKSLRWDERVLFGLKIDSDSLRATAQHLDRALVGLETFLENPDRPLAQCTVTHWCRPQNVILAASKTSVTP
jgi:hypothetical protein